MNAPESAVKDIIEKFKLMSPECGSYEASFDSFKAWYDVVKDLPSGINSPDGKPVPFSSYDVESLLGDFDADLKEFAEKMNKETNTGV